MVNSRASSKSGRGEFLAVEAEDLEETRPASDGGDVVGIDFDTDVAAGQFAHDADKAPGREGGGAAGFDLGLHLAADADVEVGGGQLEEAAVGLNQNIGKNREGGPVADDMLDLLEPFEESFPFDLEFHNFFKISG